MSFVGYCPKNSRAIEPVKKVLLWAWGKNGGPKCVMSIKTLVRLVRENHGVKVCRRTVAYALKRLQLDGFISRQTQWRKLPDGSIERKPSATWAKRKMLRDLLGRGMRGLKLALIATPPSGRGVVQELAHGVEKLIGSLVPRAP